MWVKRASLASGKLHAAGTSDTYEFLFDDSNFGLTLYNGDAKIFETTRALRDISAWYSIVLAYNTGLSGTNKVKLFINGVQETSFSTDNRSSAGTMNHINQDIVQYVGRTHGGGLFDGYMAEVCIIDGTAYAASDFGEFDGDSGIWKPIDVSGLTFGTNGFYLDFKVSGNLGNDANGGTDLTENNIAATDQMIDTCTNNFPTLNSLESSTVRGTNTYSQGNLQVLTPQGETGNTFSTVGVSSGKWYSEFYIKANSGIERSLVGVSGDVGATLSVANNVGSLSGARDVGYMGNDGDKFVSGSESSYGGSAFSVGDVIGVALDLDNNTVNFAQNNSFKGTIAISSTGTFHMGCGDVSGGARATIVANYGQNSSFAGSITAANNADEHGEGLFKYSPPSGFITLNTKNLAEYG
tara:strand:- start:393 stop:1622 length:1230 start_codon:yes stop_codon:yes gene_type:complete